MLFAYTYVPHQMEKMQDYIDFIFHEVWCKAPAGLEFDADLFDASPELKEIISEFGFSSKAPERGKTFYRQIKAIYQLFGTFTPQQTDQLKHWYKGNNDPEKISCVDGATSIARYADITAFNADLSTLLASFFSGLYDKDLLQLAAFKSKIGSIDDHYKKFAEFNSLGTCPFCGTAAIQGKFSSTREAYDHYLPKALYPFNSINFRNLLPACHSCNSGYKTSKDPAHAAKDASGTQQRRKFFYPYTTKPHAIQVSLKLGPCSIDKLKPVDLDLEYGPPEVGEEISTWRDVYGIDERYSDKLCSAGARAWVEEVRILMRRLPASDSMAIIREQTEAEPFLNSNFLKNAFLTACDANGLFAVMTKFG